MKPSRSFAIKASIITAISLLILGYGLFQARNIINGPEINITTPKDGENVADPLVSITGSTTNITYISLDDRQIFIDKAGSFSEKLLVPPGYTIIKLEARDKFGRTTKKLIQLNYTSNDKFGISNAPSTATSTQNIIQ